MWGEGHFILFLKTKKAKPPSMKTPWNEQPKISLLWWSSSLGWSSCGCRPGSSTLTTSFSHAQVNGWGSRAGWVPSQCYLAVPAVLSAYSEDKLMPHLHPDSPNQSCFHLLSEFCIWWFCQQQELFTLTLPTAAPSSVHLPVLACGTQVCTKTWQFSLLMYLRLLFLIDSPHSQHNFPSWSKLWAPLCQWEFCLFLSLGQDFLCYLQILLWICSPFYAPCLLWNLLPMLFKYSLFLPVPFPLNAVLWSKVLVGKPGEIFSGEP